jgi:large subunit ribosomal protein L25
MSSDQIQLKYQPRTIVGKQVKKLFTEGYLPIVINEHGRESIVAQASLNDTLKVVRSAGKHHPVIMIGADNKKITTIIKEISYQPTKQTLNHVVFATIEANQIIEAEIPIKPLYQDGNESSPAERAGLLVIEHLENVEVEALAKDLPDVIFYDAEKLINPSDHVTVEELMVPDGVTIKTDLNQSVASVYEPSAVEAANNSLAGDEETASPVEATSDEEESEPTQEEK